MSRLSRLVSLSSRLAGRRFLLEMPLRATPVLQQQSVRFAARIAIPATSETRPWSQEENPEPLRDILRQVNEMVQRTGRLYANIVTDAIEHAERLGMISGTETQLLLRATGSFLKELSPSERDKLTARVWALAPKDSLDISHYNTLLHVKLENGAPFDPSDFLQELSDAKIAPNRVTYQRFVQRYCEMGDIQNATKIIEFMKSQNLAVTDKVFHALIIGHLKAGDREGAQGILKLMESADMKPSEETQTIVAVGLADRGDVAGALEVLKSQHFSEERLLRIAKAVAMQDDLNALEQVLDTLGDSTARFSDMFSIIIELIAARKLDAALLFQKRAQALSFKKEAPDFFVCQVARGGYSASDAVRVWESLKDPKDSGEVFIEATRLVVNSGDKARAEDYIAKMRELNLPIRAHYYYPILCSAPDEAAVFSALKKISELEPFEEKFLTDFVVPRIDITDAGKAHARLVELGSPASEASLALAIQLVKQGRLADCEKVLVGHNVTKTQGLPALMGINLRGKEDIPTAIRILEILTQQADLRLDPVARFVEYSGRHIHDVIEALSKTRLPLTVKSFNRLRNSQINIEPLSQNVVEVAETQRRDYSVDREWVPRTMEENEVLLSQAEYAGRDTSRLLRTLLIDYCKRLDVDKIEGALRKLEESRLSAANLSLLTECYTRVGNADRAMHFVKQAIARNLHLNPLRSFALAELLVKQKRLFEASELIEKSSSNIALSLETFKIDGSVSRLLLAIFQNYGKDACLNFFERYISKHVNARALGLAIKDLIETDVIEAFELFKEVAKKYGNPPCKWHLARKLVKEDKNEEIATLLEITEKLYGPIDTAADMVQIYLECDKMVEAKDMLARCTGSRGKFNLVRICNYYVRDGQKDRLKLLLGLLEEMKLQPELVALYRIQQYNAENNVAAALELWTQAQDDNILLDRDSLRTLADLLERNGQEVPFVAPDDEPSRRPRYAGRKFSEFDSLLEQSVDKALEYRASLKGADRQLAADDVYALINGLVDQDRIKEALEVVTDIPDLRHMERRGGVVISKLLSKAASKGMIPEIQAIVDSSAGFGGSSLQKAYIASGRIDEYLTRCETKLGFHFHVSMDLMKDPALATRVENLAYRWATELQNHTRVAQLWWAYVVGNQTEKAVELQNKYPELVEILQLKRIPSEFHRLLTRDAVDRVIQMTENPQIRSKAVFYHLQNLAGRREFDEARRYLDYAHQIGVDTSTFPASLLQKINEDGPSENQSQQLNVEAQWG